MTWSAPSEPTNDHVPGAAHAGHLRAEHLGELHGEGADASRRPVDQHLLPRLNPALATKALQGGERGHGTAAACSNDRSAGFCTSPSSGAATYSAKVPVPTPNTSSPGVKRVTFPPMAATTPARSTPSRLHLGLPSLICGRATQGFPPWHASRPGSPTPHAPAPGPHHRRPPAGRPPGARGGELDPHSATQDGIRRNPSEIL
jgi:hypothetical protein